MSLLFLPALACGSKPPPTPPTTPPVPTATASAAASASGPAVAVVSSKWQCIGDPPDVAPGWRMELATVPATEPLAVDHAYRLAQEKMRAKLCVNADKDRSAADACSLLASKMETWTSGTNGRDVCASYVIKTEKIVEWERLASDLSEFDKRLDTTAQSFVKALRDSGTKSPRIALVAVYDDNSNDPKQNQLPGGRRADWLASRFRASFAGLGGLITPPKAWADLERAPNGYDLVITGKMYKKVGISVPTVDVTWTGVTPDARQFEFASGNFPEPGAPPGPAATPPAIPTTNGLWLTMDSDHVGSICAGETTQLWLKSSEEMHVRVFDLWAPERGMLVYPPDKSTSDVIKTGKMNPLGDAQGFEAIPGDGSPEERFLVIASRTTAGLGAFANMTSACRLSPNDAAQMHKGLGLPQGAKVAVTGYRLLTGEGCPPGPSAEAIKKGNDAIARLPVCSH